MRKLAGLIAGVALVASAAAPAAAVTADGDPWVPIFNKERVYFDCAGTRVNNLEPKASFPWDTVAPTASYTTGGGCISFDSDKLSGDHVTFKGKHTGNLDRLTVYAWVVDAGPVRAGAFPDIWANVSLTIDGELLVGAVEAKIRPTGSPAAVARLLQFSIVDIGLVQEEHYGEHEVEITLETAAYLDGDQIGWVWDASEVQSGVTFSPDSATGVVISVLG